MKTIIRTYKYRLYPTKRQENILIKTLSLCQKLYNLGLEQRILLYNQNKKSVSYNDQQNELPEFKKQFPEFNEIYAWTLQDVLHRLDKTFQNFFRRIKKGEKSGFPRFKSKDRYDSFTYPGNNIRIENDRLKLNKISNVKIRLSRPIDGKIKICTIRRDLDRWYACFSVEKQIEIKKRETNRQVGIDVGIKNFATLINGKVIENPKFLQESESKLKKEQRSLSKKKKRSNNRKKQRFVVAKTHRKIKEQREDFLHKESRKVINEFDRIYIEDLNINGMVKNHYLAKSINDASWGSFLYKLSYKAEEAGVEVKRIPRFYPSSKTCNVCGYINADLKLNDREWTCPQCKTLLDRDKNASMNILKIGQGMSELTLGEIKPLGGSKNQEYGFALANT